MNKTHDNFNRDLCININNHQKSSFHPLGNFLNPTLALLGQDLKMRELSVSKYLCPMQRPLNA
ncbi:hypothetical protein [Bathymodiolus thermophilus thioautotrophic gill symbiont]|uniref:Uncharacterized protein n=1 Tax=Bathymodiolus thermophilus thioautotrophic gill symbiont TaxID=2360 RepID=A0A8H8XDE6_9GAMM|nr:hypothetical protein [Bathymodiolus thermophilus thioautotrophic gill symbiont]CAB5504418.1 hypothetical protein THERMOS_1955 [Bathymodiolus thermophilus thioautotrophic gill symbiont]